MKKLACTLFALALLHGCSSSETAPDAAPLPHPDEAAASAGPSTESGDALFAAGETPAEATAANSSAATTESQAADSLLATPVDGAVDASSSAAISESSTAAGAESLVSPTPSEPSALPPASEPTPVPKVSLDHEVKPTPSMPAAKADPRKFDTYEAYKEYQEKESARRELQKSYDERALFPHEGGNWQISLDYARNIHQGRIRNSRTGKFDASSEAAQLSFLYFPLKDLSIGGLGIGPLASMAWTKYTYPSSAANKDESSKKRSAYAYGIRATYEFNYWLGQLVVPFALFDFQKLKISSFDRSSVNVVVPSQSVDSKRYGLGAHLNLNRLEGVSASRGLANLGIRKTYLSYSFLKDGEMAADSGTHALGLRFEY